jgi:hypothetical protein
MPKKFAAMVSWLDLVPVEFPVESRMEIVCAGRDRSFPSGNRGSGRHYNASFIVTCKVGDTPDKKRKNVVKKAGTFIP